MSDNTFFFSHLAHEVGDHPVEGGTLESEALLAGAEGAEVLRGLWHHVGTQLEISRVIQRTQLTM